MTKVVKCAECECTLSECKIDDYFRNSQHCVNCIKEDDCCCLPLHVTKERECCNDNGNGNCDRHWLDRDPSTIDIRKTKSLSHYQEGTSFGLCRFFSYTKSLYVAALGIEILCIAAAEIDENTGLYLFGFNSGGIAIAYMMGYALAGFTTFITILGRYNNHQGENHTSTKKKDSCCSVLEQDPSQGFLFNLKTTFMYFALGFKRLLQIRSQKGLKIIAKSSLYILVTTESACILTAETVDLVFYQYSVLLSVPLTLMAGAFTVVVPAAYRKTKHSVVNTRTAGIA
jgi:hypothetical protein